MTTASTQTPDMTPAGIEARNQQAREVGRSRAARAIAKALLAMRKAADALRRLRTLPYDEVAEACDIGGVCYGQATPTAKYLRQTIVPVTLDALERAQSTLENEVIDDVIMGGLLQLAQSRGA